MASVYIPTRSEQLSSSVQAWANTINTVDRLVDSILGVNPHISRYQFLDSNTPLLLVDGSDDEQICRADFRQFQYRYQHLSPSGKRSVLELGLDKLEVVGGGVYDWLEENGLARAGDINTFGGGAIAGVQKHSSALVDELKKIDSLLLEYANAHAHARHPIKIKIQQAYQELQRRFGAALERMINRSPPNHAQHAAHSPQRAMKMALQGQQAPLTSGIKSQKVFTVANGLKVVGRGVLFLDLGLRGNNILQADNQWRTAVSELGGFLAGVGVGLVAGAIGATIALTPVGWAILLVGAGLTAVAADYAFKDLFGSAYDSISTFF